MNIKIQKYDPAVDAAPYYIEHEVPWREFITVLEAINYVHEEYEAVNFDYSCHGRMCGRCSVMLDGVPVLACATVLDDADHVIEPHKGMPIIRDLVVDKREFTDRLSRVYVRKRIEPIKLEEIPDVDLSTCDTVYGLENCARCGLCNAACPVVAAAPDEYVGPVFMVATGLRYYDSYDQADRVFEAVGNGLYRCIECGMCDTVCPRTDIDHLGLYTTLRAEAEARGIKPSYANKA